ncbi:hypothetical protein FEZ18_13000 [Oceanihabitans sp. IOP_32]|uniref:FKBP-type peptidyl-prolyl cis-trans isomerase n=1 Tax=Oceanihabitans sp. IOP_32 TaxID=2529032 RepID=UPI0012940937|nr:hypothetical protein [Oceanihabitans sp. IOP_32]QFZ55647.1 hypothetical protein FEZ18_13000 [Oceanihabitans sp. IOP_32]
MKLVKIALSILCLAVGFLSCNKDDDNNDIIEVEIRDRGEQQVADNDSIIKYLKTHYYNSSELAAISNPSIEDIIITKFISGTVPDGNTLLMNAVEKKTVNYADTNYDFYMLKLNQGGGADSPSFADSIRARYEGILLDDTIFDSSLGAPLDSDLITEIAVEGWRRVFPYYNTAESFIENSDGTISYINKGLGIMFLPSGLAYFSSSTPSFSAYSPLIFKFELLQMERNDHDNDGIPSYLEDLNGDGEFTLDDDTDGDGISNYLDVDDDDDGIPTIRELKPRTYSVNTNVGEQEPVLEVKEFEYSRTEAAGIITIKTFTAVDSNNDGIDDYLDKNIAIEYTE